MGSCGNSSEPLTWLAYLVHGLRACQLISLRWKDVWQVRPRLPAGPSSRKTSKRNPKPLRPIQHHPVLPAAREAGLALEAVGRAAAHQHLAPPDGGWRVAQAPGDRWFAMGQLEMQQRLTARQAAGWGLAPQLAGGQARQAAVIFDQATGAPFELPLMQPIRQFGGEGATGEQGLQQPGGHQKPEPQGQKQLHQGEPIGGLGSPGRWPSRPCPSFHEALAGRVAQGVIAQGSLGT